MPQFVYKIFLALLVLSLSTESIELSFITSVLVLILCATKTLSSNVLTFGILIITVTFIGAISTSWLSYPLFDLLKDTIYFSRPITVLFASYFVTKQIKSITYVFNVVVVIAFLFALRHILVILINVGSYESYINIRSLGGKHNHIELIALVFLFFTPYVSIFKKYRKAVKFILFVSIILYFSRTMLIVFFIFYLGHKGYLHLNRKFLKGFLIFGLTSIILGIAIYNVETTRDSDGLKKFIYKTQNSFKELFVPFDSEQVKRDRRMLWEHWRAYEAQKAIEQLNESGIKAWLIGMGYGTKVELDIEVKLQGKLYAEVPSIHNGYIYILFKTGILGLFFYLLFILSIFFKHQKFKGKKAVLDNMIVASSLYLLFSSFVVTGFYRAGEFSMFLFGLLIASKIKTKTTNQSESKI